MDVKNIQDAKVTGFCTDYIQVIAMEKYEGA